jgi:hypothetical protein
MELSYLMGGLPVAPHRNDRRENARFKTQFTQHSTLTSGYNSKYMKSSVLFLSGQSLEL